MNDRLTFKNQRIIQDISEMIVHAKINRKVRRTFFRLRLYFREK